MRRLTITLTDDLENEIRKIKQVDYDSSYGSIIRMLIKEGLKVEEKKGYERDRED